MDWVNSMATVDTSTTTTTVRKQYERFPYPHRTPSDESQRFLFTPLDDLAALNFYCFQGCRDIRDNFRVLVAGGGTGDSTIHLAEQLRDTNATLVHLDLSAAAIEVAHQRAQVRNLENIVWVQGSLLDFPNSEIKPFDYINCSGVLHHLHDPAEGLKALKAMLKDDGAMGLMLYGKYARTGVYQMQQLMRLVNRELADEEAMVANTRAVLESLPNSSWYERSKGLYLSQDKYSDAEIFDLFLHSTDQPFSVSEIYELLAEVDMTLV